MDTKPLNSEAIALTEKKMDMTLDDIIKMSKTNIARANNKQRVYNRNRKFVNNAPQDKNAKRRRFMDSRSTVRQGALAQRRSNFHGNQFHLTSEAAKKAAVTSIRRPFSASGAVNVNKLRNGTMPVQRRAFTGGAFNMKRPQQQVKVAPKQRPQTLDSLFANMKMQRNRVMSQQNNLQQNNFPRRNGGGQQMITPWQRARFPKSH